MTGDSDHSARDAGLVALRLWTAYPEFSVHELTSLAMDISERHPTMSVDEMVEVLSNVLDARRAARDG